MKTTRLWGALSLAALLLTAGCSAKPAAQDIPAPNNAVAASGEMAEVHEVVEEGMTPLTGDQLRNGVYPVTADSSSAMFQVEACELTVQNGSMTAKMTMGGTGYRYIYMGTGEQAAAAAESAYIPFAETETGAHTFTVPVEALDQGIDCAAFSKKKEKWYDRTLLFRADSLPADAFAPGVLVTAESLSLPDGSYLADVTLTGGSGRASVSSPAKLTVQNGEITAEIVWSSPNYDYMKIGTMQYPAAVTDGHAVCSIPVTVFDRAMPVKANTTAMSEPHEIDYTLRFDSASITPADT